MIERCSDYKGCSCIVRHMPAVETEGRRARQRRQLLQDIEAEARRLLDEGGVANVSMRAIARGVGMGPASLYTYFDSLDDVYTTLLLSSYGRLAEATSSAIAAFGDTPPQDRILVGILAYRRWALAHPNEFNLIFSDQLPGYEAPPGGPTIAAQVAVFQPIVDAFAELRDEPEPSRLHRSALVWTAFHGAVALEVNNHLDWVDDLAALYETAVRSALAAVEIPAPSSTLRRRFERRAAGA